MGTGKMVAGGSINKNKYFKIKDNIKKSNYFKNKKFDKNERQTRDTISR